MDHQTIEDKTVTLRHRDSMEQNRVLIADLHKIIGEEVGLRKLLEEVEREPEC